MTNQVTPVWVRSLALRLFLVLLLLNGALLLWAAYSVIDSKQGYEDKARVTTQNLARMLDQSLSATVGKIDLTLLSAVDELEHELREHGRLDASRCTAFLLNHRKRLAELSSLRVADASGLVILGDGVAGSAQASWADRDFFSALRDHSEPGMVVTSPIMGRLNKVWIISFVRRFNQPNGTFAGVVSASISVTYLGDLLAAMDVGPHGTVTLRDAKLGLIARHPALTLPAGAIGAKGFPKEISDGVAAGRRDFSFHSKATSDGVERTVSYRRISGAPLHIVVGQGSEDYLAAWTVGVQRTYGALALFFLATCAFGWLLWRAQLRKQQSDAQRRQGEQLLRTSEEQMAASQEMGSTGSWSYDMATMVIAASAQSLKMFGFPPTRQDYPLATFLACIPERERVGQVLAEAISTGQAYDDEYLVRPADGSSEKTIHAIGRLEKDALGIPLRVVGFIQDITERRHAEHALQQQTQALERSNAELEQFAYVASHDLRQPLRMVNSYMQLLERALADKLDDKTREMMHFATDGAKRMDQMLVSLLEYSRVGRKGEPLQPLASRAAVEEALHFLAPSIQEAQATVRMAGDWPQVLASRNEFTRLWQNLIGNAVKYRTPERAPQIDITVTPEPEGGGWRFCVADNGIGIDPAQFERLFKVFQRLHAREAFEGNGIGLAVARKIVERHGGRIWVESAGTGQGCRFCFKLPTALAGETTP
jgi:signal transduction histidine kinase